MSACSGQSGFHGRLKLLANQRASSPNGKRGRGLACGYAFRTVPVTVVGTVLLTALSCASRQVIGGGCPGASLSSCSGFSWKRAARWKLHQRQHQRQRHAGPALKTPSVWGAVETVLSVLLKLSRSAWPARKIDGWAAFHAPRTAQEGRRQLGRVWGVGVGLRPGGTREAQEPAEEHEHQPRAITVRP